MISREDAERVANELQSAAKFASEADKLVANAKSARNIAAGDEGAFYSWLTPEQTLEARAAAMIRELVEERDEAIKHGDAMAKCRIDRPGARDAVDALGFTAAAKRFLEWMEGRK